MVIISPSIFKAYDIRGIIGETLDANIAKKIGQVFGKIALKKKETSVVIGRDGRFSGLKLATALALGLQSVGIKVIDLGMVTTPMLYYATHVLHTQSGIMVTGSHNPSNYNGFKMILAGETIYGDAIQEIYTAILKNTDICNVKAGIYQTYDISTEYIKRIVTTVRLARPMKIAIDCGNGVAGAFVNQLYRSLGCDVTELFCKVDSTFPNHHPDPANAENLQDLILCVKQSNNEIGLAFDGDGDRLGVVTKDGQIIYPDRQLMLFIAEILTRYPGQKILYDVKCTRHLAPWIIAHGGTPVMWKTGHSFMKAKMHEIKAPLGGEMSGHIFFKDRWYGFDDGLYAGVRLLEILSREINPSLKLNALPQSFNTPELQLQLNEGENFWLMTQLQKIVEFPGAEQIIKIDGLRIEYINGFGLIRASNTTAAVIFRFEAETQQCLSYIQNEFKRIILGIRPNLKLPF